MGKYRIVSLIIIVVLILMLSIVICFFARTKSDEQIKIAIYPSSGGLSETYYFEMKSNGKLLVEKGDRIGDDLTQNHFMQKEMPYEDSKNGIYEFKSEKKRITASETEKIYDLVNEIYEHESFILDAETIFDSWTIQILYKGRTIKQDCFENDILSLHELIDALIYISPININLRGFA